MAHSHKTTLQQASGEPDYPGTGRWEARAAEATDIERDEDTNCKTLCSLVGFV